MAKKRILACVNTLQAVNSFVYANHIELFARAKTRYPDFEFIFYAPHRMSIDMARNTAAMYALRHECDYLWFIDDDVLVPGNAFELLYEANKDVIAGLVIIRGMPFNVMAFKWNEHFTELIPYNALPFVEGEKCTAGHETYSMHCEPCQVVPLKQLVDCGAVGFSCCLIKTDVLSPLIEPYFITGTGHTEDVYFCINLRKLEPIPEIVMHTGVRPGHLLNPEPIEFATRKKFYDFYKTEWDKANAVPKRDAAFIKRCFASLGVSDSVVSD